MTTSQMIKAFDTYEVFTFTKLNTIFILVTI